MISAHAYLHIYTQSTYHRVVGPGLVRTAGGMSRAGFAPHGIRGAFNIIDNQVAIVARLETFMCTDPPRRDSRLRFLVFSQDSRDALHDLHVRQRHARTLLSSPPAMTLTWTLTPSPSRVYYRALGPSRSWFSSRNAQSPPVTPPSSSSLSMINVAFLDAPEYMQI